jgi:hypothetical protein
MALVNLKTVFTSGSFAVNTLYPGMGQKMSAINTNSTTFSTVNNIIGSFDTSIITNKISSISQSIKYPKILNTAQEFLNSEVGKSFNTAISEKTSQMNNLPTAMGYTQIAKQNAIQGNSITPNNIQDYRSKIDDTKNAESNWNFAKNQQIFGKSNPGATDKNSPQGKPTSYLVPVPGYMDVKSIDSMYPTVFKSDSDPWIKLGYTDSIKLGFECMSNDYTQYATALIFRALLSNGFTDNNSANLNAFRYMGRGEEFFTYQGFTRQISFSFKIAAFSRSELKPMYNKLNYLISQVYPDYSPNTNIMRAPLVKLTLGDYLYRVPGFIESINVTADNSTPWEINLEEKTGLDNSSTVQELPHVLEIAISFKPIHNALPQRASFTMDKVENKVASGGTETSVTTTLESEMLIGNYTNAFISTKSTSLIAKTKSSQNGLDYTGKFRDIRQPQSQFVDSLSTTPPVKANNFGGKSIDPGSISANDIKKSTNLPNIANQGLIPGK